MDFLARLSVRNRALIALVTIVATLFGGLALTSLKQELIPSVEFPQLTIVTAYPGASPEVVNADVSVPIETAIQGIQGLESTTSTSSTGSSVVSASFTYGTDLAFAEQKLLSAVNRVKSTLPDSTDPQVIAFSIDNFPIIAIAVTGGDNPETLSDNIERTVVGELNDLDGVSEATVSGDVGRRVTIVPDATKLALLGLTSTAISTTLNQNGVLIAAGSIIEGDAQYAVQAGQRLSSVEDLRGLPVVGARTAATLGDVASIEMDSDPVSSISRVNGEDALTISVSKLASANTVEVSHRVNEMLGALEASLQTTNPGATFTVVFDQAPFIEKSIETLATEGMLGLFFAVVVILIFLFSVRATIVTAISIPLSVLITFIGMQAAEYTMNILTLGALTIAIGRVVDDSIVVIENIKRHLVEGSDRASTIVLAVKEVAGAITASTITTVAVFLPIALVEGMTGELFRPFSLTVTIALVASLFVSLTIVPVLAYWFLKPGKRGGVDALADETGADELEHPSRLQKAYLPILNWTVRHSAITLILSVLVLIGTMAAAPFMKTNFLGSSGQNTFSVTQTLEPGRSLEAMDAASTEVEQAIRDVEGVEIVQTTMSVTTGGLRAAFGGSQSTITYSVTTDTDADADAIQAEVRESVDALGADGEITVGASQGGFGSSAIAIEVRASNQEDLQNAAEAVEESMLELDGMAEVSSNLSDSLDYIAVEIDREAAAAVGYSEIALSSFVSGAMAPQVIGSVVIDENMLRIYQATESVPVSVEELAALEVPTLLGPVRLDSLATVEVKPGPTSVTTVEGFRSATVSITPESDNVGAASALVTQQLATVDLPTGATATIGGVTSDQAESFSQLGLALLAAFLIVYIVMVATFGSLLQPLLLLISVPFAATGAIGLQIVTGVPLGVASLIGVLMLIGIVVTNAIVLIDLVNQYRAKGQDVRSALIHGASRRLRPILMTALATIFALLPMASGLTGGGGFISQPLAIVVVGGLLSSTVLTLLVLPTLYYAVESRRERRAAKKAAKRAAKQTPASSVGTTPGTDPEGSSKQAFV